MTAKLTRAQVEEWQDHIRSIMWDRRHDYGDTGLGYGKGDPLKRLDIYFETLKKGLK